MDTTTATTTATTAFDFTAFAPANPVLPAESQAEFFANAPRGTLLGLDDELYLFGPTGLWLALGEVVTEQNFGSPYSTWESYTPESLAERVVSWGATVRVLRLGDGFLRG